MVLLYAVTIFLSAFLLFQVQPMVGKMVLPWFGGSAAVWSTCMLFFQLLLLLGYLYAHLTTRYLRPRRQALLHIVLLFCSALLLPIVADAGWKPVDGDDPTLRIIGLLLTAIGLPYFLLSSTGPLLQAWYARELPGAVPYRLFALSNFGSLLGLVSYPLLFEPWLAMPRMSAGWSVAYGVFAFTCALLAWRGQRGAAAVLEPAASAGSAAQSGADPGAEPLRAPSARARLRWATLAALPTILLMAVTSHLTQDIAPIPLLWVLPLTLYLLTFILCFEGRGWYRRSWYLPLFALAVLAMLALYLVPTLFSSNMGWLIATYSAGLFLSCMVCHGELASLKPGSAWLTSYYLMVAAGGAAGGVFVAVIAPRIFNDDYELVLALIAALLVVATVVYRDPAGLPYRQLSRDGWVKASVFVTTLVSVFVLGKILYIDQGNIKYRNFYGLLRVKELGEGHDRYRRLAHGSITHGVQYLERGRQRWPTTYYGTASGVGMALAQRGGGGRRVGVVGLGAGTLAAYCHKGDYFRFYEINPLVIHVAATQFSYVSDCPGQVDIVPGDARLSLARETPQRFDVLVLDAFSGDAIPVHLLTAEAFAVYLRHLRPDGILAVHTSNLNLDLVPIVKLAASGLAMEARRVMSAPDSAALTAPAEWVLLSRHADSLRAPPFGPAAQAIALPSNLRAWTDDYSSIFRVLR